MDGCAKGCPAATAEERDAPKRIYLYVSFVLATAAMAAASYFLGYYALFFVLLS